MRIRCYGSRGSIPVSGRQFSAYGGDTTCLEVRTCNEEVIIVDAGSGIRRLGERLLAEGRFSYHILFTHAHLDHIIGFPFFKPIYLEKAVIQIMGCPTTQGNIKKLLSKNMMPPFFPVPFESLKADIRYTEECSVFFEIDGVKIYPIKLNHPNVGNGYKFVENGKSFVFMTDNELSFDHGNGRGRRDYLEFSKGADILFHDAEYTPEEYRTQKGWGHSTYFDALDLAIDAGVKHLGLFHHNQGRSDAELDEIVRQCRYVGLSRNSRVKCSGVQAGSEWIL